MALILCLLITSSLALIGTIAFNISHLNQKIVHNYASGAKAFYVAEAGREQALAYLRSNLLWRGGNVGTTGIYEGGLGEENRFGTFSVTVADGTDDQNGIFDPFIPGCYVKLSVSGVYGNSLQASTSLIRFMPNPKIPAEAPFKAVVTSGIITGTGVVGLNGWGKVDSHMVVSETTLPFINQVALRALADIAVQNIGKEEFDAYFSSRSTFWKDKAATQPYIVYVQGDLILSDTQHLFGIIFVEGDHVAISDEARMNGVLFAPHADRFYLQSSSTASQPVVAGQVLAGPSGIAVTGNAVTVQMDQDYVAAFNSVAGQQVCVEMQSGSWTSFPPAY